MRPAHREDWRAELHAELWLLAEWPPQQAGAEPSKYWLSNLPAQTPLVALVRLAKHRWIVERDYLELKQELGLGHFEARSWRGFHHHATLCIATYGFLAAERSRFSASARREARTGGARVGCRLPVAAQRGGISSGVNGIRLPRCAE